MTYFVIDVEADGPAAGPFSMVSFGAVRVDRGLKTSYRANVRPISDNWKPQALAVSRVTREQHLQYPDPKIVMPDFREWVEKNTVGEPVFVSDNPAFDWSFLNYYLHVFAGDNPFGHSAKRIGDIYSGIVRNLHSGSAWRERTVTKPTHDPLVDAIGNAEALVSLMDEFGLLRGENQALIEI